MKSHFINLTLASLTALLLAPSAGADAPGVTREEVAAHIARMDAAEELKLDLLEAVDARSSAGAARAAAGLRPLLDSEHDFWVRSGDAEAITLSDGNRAALSALAAASRTTSPDAIQQAALALIDSCSACHDAHPEARRRIRP